VCYLKLRGTHFGVAVSVSSVANFRNSARKKKYAQDCWFFFPEKMSQSRQITRTKSVKSPYLNNGLQHAPSLYFRPLVLAKFG